MRGADPEKQRHFDEKTRIYQEKIRSLIKNETASIDSFSGEGSARASHLWGLSNDMLNLASNYMAINGICRIIFDQRDEESLGEARKAISKAIIYLENVVTSKIDVPFSEYEENLAELSSTSAEAKLAMTRKIGLAVELLKSGYGDNTKWRWSFVDMEGRFTTVAKNLLDARKAFANNDPSSPDYQPILYHLHLVKDLLYKQAHLFQERFSLAAKSPDDMRLAMNYLSALRQFHIMLNEQREAAETKKKCDAWEVTYQTELKKIRQAHMESR